MSNKRTGKSNLKSYPDRQEYSSEELEGSSRNIERRALHPDRNMSGNRRRGNNDGNKQNEGKPGPSKQENEEETTEVVDKKERTESNKKEIILYVLVAVVPVLVAMTVYNTYQLKKYGNKFAEMDKHTKFLDMLKGLKADVPSLETRMESVNQDLFDVNNRIGPLQNELKGTEEKVTTANVTLRNMKAKVDEVNTNMEKLKSDVITQSNQSHVLTQRFNELEPRVSKLAKNVSETEIKVLPSIEMQKQLVKNVTGTLSDVESLKSSVNIVNNNLTDIETKMEKLQPKFDYVKEAVIKSKELEKKISKIDINVKRESKKADFIQNRIIRAKQQSNYLSQKLTQVQTLVMSSDKTQDQLQQKQTQLNESIVTNDMNIKAQSSDLVNIQSDVSRLKQNLTTTANDLNTTLTLVKDDVEKTEIKWSTLRKETVDFKKEFDITVDKIEGSRIEMDERVKEEEKFTLYVRNNLPNVVADVNTIKGSVSIPWFSIMDFLQLAAIVFMVIHMFCPQYSVGDNIQDVNYKHTEDDLPTPSMASQRPKSILDQVHRAPVLDEKICIVSFYTDTKKLHRSLVDSAAELSRRGRSMGIVQHLVKGDDDILTIPRARYILVFVDYNERNVILENTGQDLGDKKVVTVQAAQKMGADVFVTYVRDKGSNHLFPGQLYNNELSAFTSHPVLKRLENNQRCFSVYESFNNTQREHIGKAIR